MRTIDFQIAWNRYVDESEISSEIITYYDYTRSEKSSQPLCEARFELPNGFSKQVVIPDVIIKLEQQGRHRILLVEIAYSENHKHILSGIRGHCDLIQAGIAANTLGMKKHIDPRILFVFENHEARDLIRVKFRDDEQFSHFGPCFYFGSWPDLATIRTGEVGHYHFQHRIALDRSWKTASGEHHNPFIS